MTLTRFMPTLFDRKDSMSMACGLEVRVPFSDHRLIEYVWNIPVEMKTCGGMEKEILRKALGDLLPSAVATRQKSPYPKTYHPHYRESLQNRLLRILNDSQSPLHQLFDTEALKTALFSKKSIFPVPWFGQLMGDDQYIAYLIQIDSWFAKYKVVIE